MKGFAKFANNCAEKVYKWLGQSSGKMLLATSMIGISMSSFIQAIAIFVNDKYTVSQKAFMVPQELGDAILSMACIFAVTKPSQKLMAKLVKTGKVLPKNLIEYMKENKIIEKRGNINFDFSKEIEQIVRNIEKSDKFIRSSESERISLTNPHKKALEDFATFEDSSSAIATTAAGIVSTCCVVPLLRNNIASRYQKKNIDIINNKHVKQPTFRAGSSLLRI